MKPCAVLLLVLLSGTEGADSEQCTALRVLDTFSKSVVQVLLRRLLRCYPRQRSCT